MFLYYQLGVQLFPISCQQTNKAAQQQSTGHWPPVFPPPASSVEKTIPGIGGEEFSSKVSSAEASSVRVSESVSDIRAERRAETGDGARTCPVEQPTCPPVSSNNTLNWSHSLPHITAECFMNVRSVIAGCHNTTTTVLCIIFH